MSVSIQIQGENAGEVLKDLTDLAAHLGGGQAVIAAPAPEAPKQSRSSRSTAKPDPKPEQEAPPAEEEPVTHDGVGEPDTDSADIPTVVELRAVAAEVGKKAGGKEKVKALITKYGSDNITNIPEGKRAAFKRELEELAQPEESA